jgi:hypothetical protein
MRLFSKIEKKMKECTPGMAVLADGSSNWL